MAAATILVMIEDEFLHVLSPEVVLHHVRVTQALNDHWWCRVECRQTEDRRPPYEQWLGKKLSVLAVDSESAATLFVGLLLEAELEYELAGCFRLRLVGVTFSYKMDVTPRHRHLHNPRLSEVAQELCGEYGLRAELPHIDDQSLVLEPGQRIQWGETDYALLRRWANDTVLWLRPTEAGLQFGTFGSDGDVELLWRTENGLLRFQVRGRLSPASMDGAHYDDFAYSRTYHKVGDGDPPLYETVKPLADAIKAQSREALPPGYVYRRHHAWSLNAYEKRLERESDRSIGSSVVGRGVSRHIQLRAGNTVLIRGTLDGSGTWGLTRVVHRWRPATGYENRFQATPWMLYNNKKRPRKPTWAGVVPARVSTNYHSGQLGEIGISYFWQEDTQVMARLMTPHAGPHRGFYFVPEVGDEVLVAFEDGDPERPIVIGSLWNGVHRPPSQEFWGGEADDNDVKRIVTKSGHRIQIVDKKGKETISIATPRHTKLFMSESSNETGGSMVSLHSDGDIFIHAGGRIHFRSKFFSREVG
jgi:hypothetical protein